MQMPFLDTIIELMHFLFVSLLYVTIYIDHDGVICKCQEQLEQEKAMFSYTLFLSHYSLTVFRVIALW